MKKRILVVDDSALMRRVASDIINSDSRYNVEATASNGIEALDLIKKNTYDAVVLDVNMPKMSGLELLRELNKNNINVRIMMFSSTTSEGAKETIEALELGAIDFIKKPDGLAEVKGEAFKDKFLQMLAVVSGANIVSSPSIERRSPSASTPVRSQEPRSTAAASTGNSRMDNNRFQLKSRIFTEKKDAAPSKPVMSDRTYGKGGFMVRDPVDKEIVLRKTSKKISGPKIVALASSTGGPRALQSVIPLLPENLDAAVLLVQHMPVGFTKSLAERLDSLSKMKVVEAEEGQTIEKGTVYIAAGGRHMIAVKSGSGMKIKYTDLPMREGVRPAANYMYESLMDSPFAEICCVVLTGMGADGTAGIKNLETKKDIYVIAQDESTSAVYGMPKAVAQAGLVNEILPLDKVADAITKDVGVK